MASAAALEPAPGEDGPRERLHPLSLVGGLGKALRNMVGAVAAGGYFAAKGNWFMAAIMLGGIAVATLVGQLFHWWHFSFVAGRDQIRIDSGFLKRQSRTIPFDRIADVGIEQGPLQRLAGLARVTFETGGGAGSEDGTLDGVPLARAEALRRHVRARRGGTMPLAPDIAPVETEVEAETAPLFAMDLRRVLTLGLFNFSLAIFAGLFGASQTVGDLVGFDPFERSFWRPLLERGGIGEWLLAHRFGLAASGILVLLIAGVATGVVRTVLREFGFRLDPSGNGLRRRRGLLTRTDVTLPRRRIQAGLVETGPVRARFGWRAFKVVSLGSDGAPRKEGEGASRRNHVLAPLANKEEVAAVAEGVGIALPAPGTDWRPVSRAHVTAYCLALLPLFPLLPLFGPLRWLEWRRTAYAVEGERLLIRRGWWRRQTFLIPLRNVQGVSLSENALGRRFGIATLAVDLAGGCRRGQQIPSLPRDEAMTLRAALLSRQP